MIYILDTADINEIRHCNEFYPLAGVTTNPTIISKEKDEILKKGKLNRGDIVITTRGTIGNIAYYDNSVPYENIRINSDNSTERRNIYANNNKLIIGNNVTTNQQFSSTDGSVTNYSISIFGGTNNVYESIIDNYIEINSGNWNTILRWN